MPSDSNPPKPKKNGLKPARQKADDRIMGTNDSSIVSKRSVSALYYPTEPDFYAPVTRRFQRRHPLINRGYWLRMQAVEQVVCQFLATNPAKRKVVVNLGCGYDPLPWQFWNRHPGLCGNATFVDVDYPELVQRKKSFVLSSELLREFVPELRVHEVKDAVLFSCGSKYAAVGVDLRRLDVLSKILLEDVMVKESDILFVAEVSITYMGVDDSDALIKWYLPDGVDRPFASTMLSHFKKLNTLIYAVAKYPSLENQRKRFRTAGWSSVHARSLWEFWSDLESISPEQRKALDAVEPFDEWEEFALFAGHYFVLVAHNKSTSETNKDQDVKDSHDKETAPPVRPIDGDSPAVLPATRLRLEENMHTVRNGDFNGADLGNEPIDGVRRFGAIFRHGSDIVYDGGFGRNSRLDSHDVWTADSATDHWGISRQKREGIRYRMCHTITEHSDGSILMVGGRASPSFAYNDCYFKDDEATAEETFSTGRFRHCAVAVDVLDDGQKIIHGTLIMGGKTGAGDVLDEWKFWDKQYGWQEVMLKTNVPPGRFGAAMASITPFATQGILFGGMTADGCVLSDVWRWQVELVDGKIFVSCENCTNVVPGSALADLARFGSSLVRHGSQLALIGGISKAGVLPFGSEIVLLEVHIHSIAVRKVGLEIGAARRPLLVGIGAVTKSDGNIFICGGGGICFSFGSFHNQSSYTLLGNTVSDSAPEGSKIQDSMSTVRKVQKIRISTREEFDEVVIAAKPVVMEGFDLGACVARWTPEYLIERIGADKDIVVHSCPTDRMTFQEKNFSYVKQAFGDFMQAIEKEERLYLRAVASKQPFKQPTKLDEDSPGLAGDFVLPQALGRVEEYMHSSPLRISGPVTLWLHYDVLANVLCQIRGTKTLRLYPPGDVGRLGFTAGSSSSNLDVFGADPASLKDTHPFDAEMRPGDVLYIPPMWMHGAKPTAGVSVAVNVFFRNLETGYAIGRDVYGNRDLQAYEQGRREVEKMVRSFDGIPSDIKGFYLQRLAAELGSHVDGK